ncbi:tRNA pseudouridine55 synthase [Hydrocarboniphaga daqingensis]|uniref:tRNA pseudouridine synthase B n=1 Tax=Hydrocarboniphaga daqingensis TaxID=490188 RepID=A0A1M5Q094_9GAMM|nr:tRNA pseudouridine(55) synthase TruB [Hydrocarboniphaga daqingensis]SHH06913.1 tRNA pseudouridine55 synthase [Hydrocarboniphaga daqingensis]
MNRRRVRSKWRRIDGILLLDKPLGLSSNEALQRVRRLYNAERAGHTGSLDPLATGLLPVCFGEATKLCGLLLDGDKHYHASVVLGVSTTTGDGEGQVREQSDPSDVTLEHIQNVLPRFRGPISQVPPMHSALKHQGQPLYHLARAGQEVDRPAREIMIHRLDVIDYASGRLDLDIVCSKGTYIRTLAEDIAAAVGQQAHLGALRRIGASPFAAPTPMLSFEALHHAAEQGQSALDALLTPPLAGLADWPRWQADETQLALLLGGRRLRIPGLSPGRIAVVDARDRLCGMARVLDDGLLAPERWLLPTPD